MVTVPGAVNEAYWKTRRFEPFVLSLHEILVNRIIDPVSLSRCPEPYRAVLENWAKPAELGPVISSLCDYHCRNMEDTVGDWDPEFDRPPFDLLPTDILAIYAVRQRLGLSTPQVDHPLLNSAVATQPIPNSLPEDQILSRARLVFSQLIIV